jgi:hypothetical protein
VASQPACVCATVSANVYDRSISVKHLIADRVRRQGALARCGDGLAAAINLSGCRGFKQPLDWISHRVLPFVAIGFITLLVISYFPGISIGLPNLGK